MISPCDGRERVAGVRVRICFVSPAGSGAEKGKFCRLFGGAEWGKVQKMSGKGMKKWVVEARSSSKPEISLPSRLTIYLSIDKYSFSGSQIGAACSRASEIDP